MFSRRSPVSWSRRHPAAQKMRGGNAGQCGSTVGLAAGAVAEPRYLQNLITDESLDWAVAATRRRCSSNNIHRRATMIATQSAIVTSAIVIIVIILTPATRQ